MAKPDKSRTRALLAGAVGGILAGVGIWLFASKALDKQLSKGGTELESALRLGRGELETRLSAGEAELRAAIRQEVSAQVPPRVRSTLESTLREYGITPDTGRRITMVLAGAERIGLL